MPTKPQAPDAPSHGKPSPVVDTRVIWCGDKLDILSKMSDALAEVSAFFKRTGIMIRALTVQEILDEQFAKNLA